MHFFRIALCSCLLSTVLSAQTSLDLDDPVVHWGVKGGVQALDSFDSAPGYNAEDSRFVIGGMADVRLNDYFGAEFDVLYRRYRFDALLPAAVPSQYAVSSSYGHAWDFPMLAKWKPWGESDRIPYISGGIALRYMNSSETRHFFAGDQREIELGDSFAQDSSFNIGWVVAAGMVFNDISDSIRVAPEIRYTVWSRDNFRAPATLPGSPEFFSSKNDQLDILVGITF